MPLLSLASEVRRKVRRNIRKLIGFALDKSGSMENGREEIISSYNEQIEELKKSDLASYVSFFRNMFSGDRQVTTETWSGDIQQIEPLNNSTYRPGGMTPLYDAVGDLITTMEQSPDAQDPAATFLVIVFSDGLENHSRHWNQADLANKIKKLQATGCWTFVYIGTEHDLSQATNLNIPRGNTAFFAKTPQGFSGMTRASTAAISAYMNGNTRMTNSYYGSGLNEAQTAQIGQATIDAGN